MHARQRAVAIMARGLRSSGPSAGAPSASRPTPFRPTPSRRSPFGLTSFRLTGSGPIASALILSALVSMPAAHAQAFPSHPIRFVVPFGPGSGTDTSARYFAKKLQELTGQSVVVENRAGGNGFIAVKQVLSAPADGYTVFIGSNSTLAVNTALFRQLPYDPVKDLTPLSMMMRSPALLIAPAETGAKTQAELIAAAKAKPGQLNYGAGSAGYQLMAELFNQKAGIQTYHVPYKGAADALTAVASGSVQFTFAEITSAVELAKGGRVRALAVAADRRTPAMPDVPTSAEAGLPGYTAYTWVAAMVSSSTPAAEANKLAELLTAIARQPETREFYSRLGAEVMTGGPQELRDFQLGEIKLWKQVASEAKVEQQ